MPLPLATCIEWSDYLRYDSSSLSGLKWHRSLGNRHDISGPAGNKLPTGYWRIKLKGRTYMAHRIVWELCVGKIPDQYEIDHIDGNPSNNNISNLRLATRSQNKHNRRINTRSTTGFKGVSKIKGRQRWRAEVKLNYKRVWVKEFNTPEEAHAAYCEAISIYHKEFAKEG